MYLYIIILILIILLVLLKLFSTVISLYSGSPGGETNKDIIRKVFKEIDLKKGSVFYDLGSGIGNNIIVASNEFGAKSYGYEISPLPYILSKIRTIGINNCHINYQNILKVDLSKADVIYCYLLPELLKKLEPKLKNLKNTIIISQIFKISNLKPKKEFKLSGKMIYIY